MPSKHPSPYPHHRAERDGWIADLRPQRAHVEPFRPVAFLAEQERTAAGTLIDSLCIFLTNRECPWRCVMCDLWKHTLTERTPEGAIPAQIDYALEQLQRDSSQRAPQIKLYNSGSFFDASAIPTSDHPSIAERLQSFERVIVECHPALVGERILPFRDRLAGQLEVAMGLETIHPEVLPKLNKGMTLDLFQQAAEFLANHNIALRAFVLIQPPWMTVAADAIEWAVRSVEYGFTCGTTAVSLIPTRAGNGAMDELARAGFFVPPALTTIEAALDQSIALGRGRVFLDLWELERFASCPHCFPARRERLRQINEQQRFFPKIECAQCRS